MGKKIIVMGMVVGLFSLTLVIGPALGAPIVLRHSDINTVTAPQGIFATELGKLIQEKTKGRVETKFYPSSSLAGYNIEPVQTGVAHLMLLVPSMAVDFVPAVSVLDAPYIWKGDQHIYKVTDPRSPIMEALNKQLAKHGLLALVNWNLGFRHLTANKPIYKPEDLKGMKIRSIANPIFMATVRAMGATPTPMPFPEVATALATGVIDGQENPFSVIVPTKLHEVQKNIMLTGHVPTQAVLFMNLKAWESITPEDKENVINAAIEARDKMAKYNDRMETEWQATAKAAGCKIFGVTDGLQLTSFVNAVREPVHQQFADKWGDFYQKIIDMGK